MAPHIWIIFYGLIVFMSVTFCENLSINEILSSPANQTNNNSTAESYVKKFGYPFEFHKIVTADGYILTVHRIPHGKQPIKLKESTRRVVILLHGFLASSDILLFRGSSKDLPYVLADSGYDVWICNARGNAHSRNHIQLNPDKDPAFWNFSIHEQGIYDLPATIDYVLNATDEKSAYFVGHSIGATAFLIMCSMKPEYNEKIKMMSALAPAAIIVSPSSMALKLFLYFIEPLSEMFDVWNIHEVLPNNPEFHALMNTVCNMDAITQPICISLMRHVIGEESNQFDKAVLPEVLKLYPAGTSLEALKHVAKIFSGHFGFPHESVKYNLTKVTTPISLHYGMSDSLVTKRDVEELSKRLRNVVGVFPVPYEPFNHLDFIWAKDAKPLIYDDLMNLMNAYTYR